MLRISAALLLALFVLSEAPEGFATAEGCDVS